MYAKAIKIDLNTNTEAEAKSTQLKHSSGYKKMLLI